MGRAARPAHGHQYNAGYGFGLAQRGLLAAALLEQAERCIRLLLHPGHMHAVRDLRAQVGLVGGMGWLGRREGRGLPTHPIAHPLFKLLHSRPTHANPSPPGAVGGTVHNLTPTRPTSNTKSSPR